MVTTKGGHDRTGRHTCCSWFQFSSPKDLMAQSMEIQFQPNVIQCGRGHRLAILNIEAGKLVWVLVAINVLTIVYRSTLAGVMGLTAVMLAKLLVTGNWRPKQIFDRMRLWRIERRISRNRKKIRLQKSSSFLWG